RMMFSGMYPISTTEAPSCLFPAKRSNDWSVPYPLTPKFATRHFNLPDRTFGHACASSTSSPQTKESPYAEIQLGCAVGSGKAGVLRDPESSTSEASDVLEVQPSTASRRHM